MHPRTSQVHFRLGVEDVCSAGRLWLLRGCEVRARQWNQDGGEPNLNLDQSFLNSDKTCYSWMTLLQHLTHMLAYRHSIDHMISNCSWFRSFAADLRKAQQIKDAMRTAMHKPLAIKLVNQMFHQSVFDSWIDFLLQSGRYIYTNSTPSSIHIPSTRGYFSEGFPARICRSSSEDTGLHGGQQECQSLYMAALFGKNVSYKQFKFS